MEENSSLAYSEIYEILKLIEDEYVNRIPKKIMSFFEEERDKEYKPRIDVNIPLDEQNLKRETMVLLEILNVNYWCDSEEEKQEIQEELIRNNEIKEQQEKELAERYNPDNLFKRKNEVKEQITENNDNFILSYTDNKENMQLIEYNKQGFIKKLLSKIISFLKK